MAMATTSAHTLLAGRRRITTLTRTRCLTPTKKTGEVYDDRPLPPAGQPKPIANAGNSAAIPARRPSKAERFLGLEAGEGENRRMSLQGGRSTLEEGRWEGPGYDEREDYFGDAGVPKKKGWKGILGRG